MPSSYSLIVLAYLSARLSLILTKKVNQMGNKLNAGVIPVHYKYLTSEEVQTLLKSVRLAESWETTAWGSYGPEGKDPQQVRYLSDLSTEHLEAILITQPQLSPSTRAAVLELIRLRDKE